MPTTARRRLGNLPSEVSSFIGRRRETGEVKRRLTETRLLTLTGVGGVGKTRLVLRVAAEVRRAFPHGAWFVDLTQVRESSLLSQEVQEPDVLAALVTRALGVREQGDEPSVQQLIEYLAARQTLLVLDNCEHLISACAVLVDALLRGCPTLRVMATSREPLAIGGEVLYAVPPLSTPEPNERADPNELARYESVALFLARAQGAVPWFALTEDNRVPVAQLCRRLDGLPLAIELAAARVRVLAPEQILDGLADRFTLLSRANRSAPARQQTLRACVEWSFDLCNEAERVLWARLSVFVGGFELDAVEGVCADERLPVAELVDVLADLVDKSILVRDEGGAAERAGFRMLETIRAYGEERLTEAGEQTVLRRRHRDWYQQLVAQAHADLISDRQVYWQDRLVRSYPNVRAGIKFCLTEPGEAEAALRILLDLPQWFWSSQGVVTEARDWVDRALAPPSAPSVLRARALVQAGALTLHGDTDTMTRRLQQGERLARQLHDPVALALAACVRQAAALRANDLVAAIEFGEQGLAILADVPEPQLVLLLLLQLGWAAALVGDGDRARRSYEQILEIAEPRGETHLRSAAQWGLGLVAFRAGQTEQADQLVRDSLRTRQRAGSSDPQGIALGIELLAWIAAHQQRYRLAAGLLGAANAVLTDKRNTNIITLHRLIGDHDACVRQARDALGNAAFAEAFRQGQAMPLHDALAYALDETRGTKPRPREASNGATPLTHREQQVAHLIADGLSNKEIASRLVISQRTVASHVEHILTKLGVASRAQVAAWKAAQQSEDQEV